MINITKVQNKLKEVLYPSFNKSIIEFGFLKDIEIVDNKISITLDIPSSDPKVEEQLRSEITKRISFLGDIELDITIISIKFS